MNYKQSFMDTFKERSWQDPCNSTKIISLLQNKDSSGYNYGANLVQSKLNLLNLLSMISRTFYPFHKNSYLHEKMIAEIQKKMTPDGEYILAGRKKTHELLQNPDSPIHNVSNNHNSGSRQQNGYRVAIGGNDFDPEIMTREKVYQALLTTKAVFLAKHKEGMLSTMKKGECWQVFEGSLVPYFFPNDQSVIRKEPICEGVLKKLIIFLQGNIILGQNPQTSDILKEIPERFFSEVYERNNDVS